MFYIKDTYATVWNVRDIFEKYSSISISTSEKDKNGNRKYSNWFATFVSNAHQKANTLQQKDRIKILSGKVNRIPQKKDDGTWVSYVNVVIFDFELVDNDFTNTTKQYNENDIENNNAQDDDIPF